MIRGNAERGAFATDEIDYRDRFASSDYVVLVLQTVGDASDATRPA